MRDKRSYLLLLGVMSLVTLLQTASTHASLGTQPAPPTQVTQQEKFAVSSQSHAFAPLNAHGSSDKSGVVPYDDSNETHDPHEALEGE